MGSEGVQEQGAFLVGDGDLFPIDEIGAGLVLDFTHEPAASAGAGIGRGLAFGLLDAGGVPETARLGQGQAETARGVNVVELKVLGFEPGVVPIQALAGAELGEQVSLGDPIDQADERVRIGGQALEERWSSKSQSRMRGSTSSARAGGWTRQPYSVSKPVMR